MIEIIIALLLGILIGIITGLIPGIHINLVAALIISQLPLLSSIQPTSLIIFITSMTITHIFLDFIPSCFLCSSDSNMLSILPAHKLLLKGRAYEATRLSVIGSILGLLTIIVLTPLIFILAKNLYPLIKDYIAYILITASSILIIKERQKFFSAFIVFSLAGILGISVLTMPALNQPLLPLLSGLFGTSALLISINKNLLLPPQTTSYNKIDRKETVKAISSSLVASLLTGFLPGMSSSESAILATSFFRRIKLRTYLILLGSINSMVILLSFIAILAIGKARSGSVAAIQNIIQNISLQHLILFLAVSLATMLPASLLALFFAKKFSIWITRISYKKLCIFVIAFISILVAILSGPLGLLILVVSTFIGILPQLLNVKRSHLMSSIIIPVTLFLLL